MVAVVFKKVAVMNVGVMGKVRRRQVSPDPFVDRGRCEIKPRLREQEYICCEYSRELEHIVTER